MTGILSRMLINCTLLLSLSSHHSSNTPALRLVIDHCSSHAGSNALRMAESLGSRQKYPSYIHETQRMNTHVQLCPDEVDVYGFQ